MYQSQSSFSPPLAPAAYFSDEDWQRERSAVFLKAWHLVAVASQLRRPGQYVSLNLLGVPLVIRNFDGELVALRNVCAHRQSLLVDRPQGCSARLKCPYHGWEYGPDGRTRKLPGATNFPDFQHREHAIDRFPLERCGELIFLRLTSQGPTLQEWIGPERFSLLMSWFSQPAYEAAHRAHLNFPANWKIPVEAALESYHIPCVHSKTFHEDPGETASTHQFFETGSAFKTIFLAPRWIDRRLRDVERIVLRMLHVPYTGEYEHHHVFPNLLISHTDSLSLVQSVVPTGPQTSHSLVWQFARLPQQRRLWRMAVARLWGQFTAQLTRTILSEDMQIYPLVQAGVRGAVRKGVLGRCEERLFALQEFVRKRTDQWGPSPSPHDDMNTGSVCERIQPAVDEKGSGDD